MKTWLNMSIIFELSLNQAFLEIWNPGHYNGNILFLLVILSATVPGKIVA